MSDHDTPEALYTPGGNPTCSKCGCWYGPGVTHVCDTPEVRLTEAELTPDERGAITSGRVDGVPVGVVAAACHVFAARLAEVQAAEACPRCSETAHIETLIEASSLGTPEAKAARESVPRSTGVAIRIASEHMARAEAAEQQLAGLRSKMEEVLPAECWVTRSDMRCTAMIGGTFANGAVWAEDMCCLPCRLRALLDGSTDASDTTGGESDG